MPEEEAEKALVVRNTEIEPSEPIGIRYFKAVDAMVQGIPPSDNIYYNILVNKFGEDDPTVKIVRSQNVLEGGNIDKRDEIALPNKENRLQFNAECTADGTYVKYPDNPSYFGLSYLADTVKNFSEAASVDGSIIKINNAIRLISKDGIWIPYGEKDENQKPPRLGKPQERLPQQQRKELPDGSAESSKTTAILINAILGLKKKKLA